MHGHGRLSIWFFIGVLLTAYGILITGAGIYDESHPAAHPVVLSELHMGIWWGLLLFIIGVVYFVRFYPKKQ
jgi:hypothetical protein